MDRLKSALYTVFLQYTAGISKENIEKVISMWREPSRFYHNEDHLFGIINLIMDDARQDKITQKEKEILVCAAYYHDAIYIPGSQTNEQDSAALFLSHCKTDYDDKQTVVNIILDTKSHIANSKLSEIFIDYDLHGLRYGGLNDLISDGMKIFKEYQKAPYIVYKQARIGFLREFLDSGKISCNSDNVNAYLEWLESYKPNIAIYPGTFNSFHKGHYDIHKKAEKIFDKVIVAIGINPEKSANMVDDDYEKIIEGLPAEIQNREIAFFDCFLAEFAKMKENDGANITIVKGLRDAEDLKYEFTQLRYMEDQDPDIKIVYIPASRDLIHVSSRFIRDMEKMEPGSGKKYLLE